MALDLNNYDRKDGASASNVYYGYVVNKNDSDSSKVFWNPRINYCEVFCNNIWSFVSFIYK